MAYRASGFGFGVQLTPVVKRLLLANVAVFFATWVIGHERMVEWFGFHPDRVLTHPWGLLTYMFVHADFMHLLVNMLVLFFFGPPLEGQWRSKEFVKFYLICGLGGILLSFLFAPASVIGASAAGYGIMLAFAMNWPDTPIYIWGIFPVQAKWLVAFLFAMTLFSAFGTPGGPVAHFAHLGGIVTGFLYLKADWRTERLAGLTSRASRSTRVRRLAIVPREAEEEHASSGVARTPLRPSDESQLLDAVDRVLDKISAHGMSSLTAEERRLLDEVSRRHRSH